jgi:GNAT superfamily N-acetyltransferase
VAAVEITRATVYDAEAILALQRLAYQCEAERYDDYSLPPLRETLIALQREFGRSVFLKAVGDEGICGSVRACGSEETCFIGRLIVHPACRRRGIAMRMMHEIERCFCDVDRYEPFTGYKSQGNLRLYDKLGYRIFKEEQPEQGPRLVFLEKRRNPEEQMLSVL